MCSDIIHQAFACCFVVVVTGLAIGCLVAVYQMITMVKD